jgi:uncharacterized protein (TIGR03084 family)
MTALLRDFAEERAVLFELIDGLSVETWDLPSPAQGWTLRDCVSHLADFDDRAALICQGLEPPANPREGVLTRAQLDARALSPAAMVSWYAESGRKLIESMQGMQGMQGKERLPWAGQAMSARSFLTARLMEHWSHGLDVFDAAGATPVDTDRLRHIAHLGYISRDYAYRAHGLAAPSTPLRVVLEAPSGDEWTWGPEDAPDRISGSAGDFCRVVTQRIHPSDTALRAEGDAAREFLSIAQAFAGPPGEGRAPRQP